MRSIDSDAELPRLRAALVSGPADAIRNVLDWPLNYYNAAENTAAYAALDALVVERRELRGALEIIAEHSADDGSRQLAAAALDFDALQAIGRAEAS